MQAQPSNYQDLSIDKRAYKFFPLSQQEKHNFNKPNGKRVYFHGQVQHDDIEKKKLAQFKQFLKTKYQNKYDQNYFNSHMLVLFLSTHQFKDQQTYQAMNDHMEFRSKYIRDAQGIRIIEYETDEKVKKLIDSGFFYVCGRDHHFRPLIVFNLPKVDMKDPDAVLRGVIFVQEEVIQKMLIPGQVQCWNIIYDLGGMGLMDVPVNQLKTLIRNVSANYGSRLYKLWLINAPASIYFSWKVIKNFLDPITVDKINIIKKNTDESLWKLFHKEQVEQKYGGSQPNKTKFYPFKIPKAYVDESRLITNEKYAQLVKLGVLKNNVIDPLYLNHKKGQQKKMQQLNGKILPQQQLQQLRLQQQINKQMQRVQQENKTAKQAQQKAELQCKKQREKRIEQQNIGKIKQKQQGKSKRSE